MPFTFSHPALVIPLLRTQRRYPWISTTGLITGSIAPDFEKFFRLHLASGYSHTVPSILYFSCPVALLLAFVFHLVVRRPLLAHLPSGLHQRLGRFINFNWLVYFRQHYGGVLLSVVVGAALHLAWDSFTHRGALMTRLVPVLREDVWLGGWHGQVFDVLAIISTVGGALAIAIAVWQMPTRPAGRPATSAAMAQYWGLAALVAGALAGEWVLAVDPEFMNGSIALISAMLLGVLVSSIYTNRKSLAHGRP
ncbi:DUF4184 family protein [Hymenobacter negativus]|uniref:DUF4184 family protein n=1 Tax=Hymenobacter negativus TaxID=2795026 RepID=A0ABS3QAG7_9BACT|nr:DUF4184 family protein [Hymenobacter negativus]MBO2008254.1 DUF4184 family protein [Hymenobacter negativus]